MNRREMIASRVLRLATRRQALSKGGAEPAHALKPGPVSPLLRPPPRGPCVKVQLASG